MSSQPRPMMEDEVEAVAALWHETWHNTHDRLAHPALREFRTQDYFRHRTDRERDTVYVSGAPGKPVGLCIVSGGNLDMLFIAAPERGKGIGELLLADAEARMLKSGVREAYLFFALGNDGAVRFYERHGWTNVGKADKEFQVASGTIIITVGKMTKPIRASIG